MSDDFSQRYGPWAVVAGASDGIGASVARLLGDRGVNVVLVARRSRALEEVAATVPSETRTLVRPAPQARPNSSPDPCLRVDRASQGGRRRPLGSWRARRGRPRGGRHSHRCSRLPPRRARSATGPTSPLLPRARPGRQDPSSSRPSRRSTSAGRVARAEVHRQGLTYWAWCSDRATRPPSAFSTDAVDGLAAPGDGPSIRHWRTAPRSRPTPPRSAPSRCRHLRAHEPWQQRDQPRRAAATEQVPGLQPRGRDELHMPGDGARRSPIAVGTLLQLPGGDSGRRAVPACVASLSPTASTLEAHWGVGATWPRPSCAARTRTP